MLPRPLLTTTFALPYRKIPILTIAREIYCDTSLIIEALEHFFPASPTGPYGTIYPPPTSSSTTDTLAPWIYRGLARGFASFWTDRPLFRATTGLIPAQVWETEFGVDRAGLIGHAIDAEKIGRKRGEMLASLDLHLSLLEPSLAGGEGAWAMPTREPSLADVSLWYQIRWGVDIARGRGVYNLTAGGAQEGGKGEDEEGVGSVFNESRYPGVWRWFHEFEAWIEGLPDRETRGEGTTAAELAEVLNSADGLDEKELLVPAAAEPHTFLDEQRGLVPGALVSVAPDDTGRDFPTVGHLVKIGVEEVVIRPAEKGVVQGRIHFPRLGFVVRVVEGARL
ncbi:hypothetical protein EJ04DRAFT_120401 [Polyplosphaeria fusca]|uniref:DUF7962 domain-containing protein n=1 Tax=Polyplosphaeria fusca TaxID=682080 RepID=A0A9P4QLR1_9PLEO|nr:hypothetical protein EJ04DRAFT_120401 [Polyplosphaeria fusca]